MNELNPLRSGNPIVQQQVAEPAARPEPRAQVPAQDSIESAAPEPTWGSCITDCGSCVINLATVIVSCVAAIFLGIVYGILAIAARLMGAEAQPERPAFEHITDQIFSWMRDENIFGLLRFPCKLFCIVKIYPREPSQEAPYERRLSVRYAEERPRGEQGLRVHFADLALFAAEVRAACVARNISRQNRVEMALIATHKENDQDWHVVRADHAFRPPYLSIGSQGSGTGERLYVEALCNSTPGLDHSMLDEILDNPPEV